MGLPDAYKAAPVVLDADGRGVRNTGGLIGGRFRPICASARRRSGGCRVAQTHSCLHLAQLAAHHPQVGEREQRVQLRRVLGQPAIANLHMAELAFDHPKWVFHLGTDAGLETLQFVDQPARIPALVQRSAFARAHRNVPAHIRLGVSSLVRALVARITEGFDLLAVQQRVGLDHIVHAARRAAHRVHQA
jgi:hypothetical protein